VGENLYNNFTYQNIIKFTGKTGGRGGDESFTERKRLSEGARHVCSNKGKEKLAEKGKIVYAGELNWVVQCLVSRGRGNEINNNKIIRMEI